MLKQLYLLQKLEVAEAQIIGEQKSSREYHQLRQLKRTFDQHKQDFLQKKEELQVLQQAVKIIPQSLQQVKEKIEQEKDAIYDGSISSLKELDARQTQLLILEQRQAELEQELDKKQAAAAHKTEEAKALQQKMQEIQVQFTASQKEYETVKSQWQKALSELTAEKKELLAEIDDTELTWYEGQKPLFAGQPVARLDANQVCDGCRTVATPVLYKRTVQGQQTRCEKCGRYLFVEL